MQFLTGPWCGIIGFLINISGSYRYDDYFELYRDDDCYKQFRDDVYCRPYRDDVIFTYLQYRADDNYR